MHLQSDNPTSSTSTSTTTTTTTTANEINDRVPLTNLSADDHAVSITATIEQLPQPKSDTVSASYTLTTSSHRNHDNPSSSDKQKNSDKISASYTILPQTQPQLPPSSNTVVSKEKSPNDVDVERRASTTITPTVTATINVPNTATIKTENDELSRANRTSKQPVSQIINSQNTFDDGVISTDQQYDRDNQRSSRDKRSLFDIDNASSLTLAEKLRNEANKYNEVSKSNNDISQTSDAAVEFRKSDSTPSSPHHQISSAAERRPSWRLKFDAGNKVYSFFYSTILLHMLLL